MIGDYFTLIDFNGPTRITAIYDDIVQLQENYKSEFDEEWYSEAYIKDLKPIPLTPEILEQNGFVKQAYDGWLISEDNGRGLIEYRTDYFDGFLRINYTKKPFSKISVKLKYVHELQHALRLCGINKEIEL